MYTQVVPERKLCAQGYKVSYARLADVQFSQLLTCMNHPIEKYLPMEW